MPIRLRGLNFSSSRKRVCISSRNGTGKTTLLLALAGILPVSSGRISLLGASSTGQRRRLCGVFSSGIAIPSYLSAARALSHFFSR